MFLSWLLFCFNTFDKVMCLANTWHIMQWTWKNKMVLVLSALFILCSTLRRAAMTVHLIAWIKMYHCLLWLNWGFNNVRCLHRLPLAPNSLPPPWPCSTLMQPTVSSWESCGLRSDQPCYRRRSMAPCSTTSPKMTLCLNSKLRDAQILSLTQKWKVGVSTVYRGSFKMWN